VQLIVLSYAKDYIKNITFVTVAVLFTHHIPFSNNTWRHHHHWNLQDFMDFWIFFQLSCTN